MEKIEFDYSRLRGKIREVCGTQDAYADKIHLGRVSVSQRLNNNLEFSQSEMINSAEVLNFSTTEIPQYFFVKKVQKTEQKRSK
ncbi:MAG: DUF739 family protein [Eubacteriales bacterium]|nr:DUF739 family protein [Eubacteriales bacterium]